MILQELRIKEGGMVLVVDDEPMLRNLARRMLERLGFKVITANDGIEAVETFRVHAKEICVVILDLSMPGMDGWQTLAALRSLQPGIPVILTSGYDEAQVMQKEQPEKPQVFLQKPYQVPDLIAALEAVKESLASDKQGSAHETEKIVR